MPVCYRPPPNPSLLHMSPGEGGEGGVGRGYRSHIRFMHHGCVHGSQWLDEHSHDIRGRFSLAPLHRIWMNSPTRRVGGWGVGGGGIQHVIEGLT